MMAGRGPILWLCALACAGACAASAVPAGGPAPRMSSGGGSSSSNRGVPRIEDPPLPVAYLPALTVGALSPASPAKAPAGASFQLLPGGCAGAACTGFRISNAPDFPAGRTNAATFAPVAQPLMVDPFNPKTYELATLQLTNGGLSVPADAGTTLVPLTLDLVVATQGTGKSTPVSLPLLVTWSPGSPAAPNNAGLFVLVTRASGSTPAPTRSFTVSMTQGIDFTMKLEVLGFVADPARGKDVTVLGDWGQPAPAAGQPGARAAVKQGAGAQTVKLVVRISKIAG